MYKVKMPKGQEVKMSSDYIIIPQYRQIDRRNKNKSGNKQKIKC